MEQHDPCPRSDQRTLGTSREQIPRAWPGEGRDRTRPEPRRPAQLRELDSSCAEISPAPRKKGPTLLSAPGRRMSICLHTARGAPADLLSAAASSAPQGRLADGRSPGPVVCILGRTPRFRPRRPARNASKPAFRASVAFFPPALPPTRSGVAIGSITARHIALAASSRGDMTFGLPLSRSFLASDRLRSLHRRPIA